jgi:hypothetical protein
MIMQTMPTVSWNQRVETWSLECMETWLVELITSPRLANGTRPDCDKRQVRRRASSASNDRGRAAEQVAVLVINPV